VLNALLGVFLRIRNKASPSGGLWTLVALDDYEIYRRSRQP
jgi:hypothetical protein